jgi:hypothetical protein
MTDRLSNHIRHDDSAALTLLATLVLAQWAPDYERDRPEHPFRGMTSPGFVDWHDVLPGVLAFARAADDRDCADDIQTRARICSATQDDDLPPTYALSHAAYGMSALAFNHDGDTWIVSKDDRNDTSTVTDKLPHDRMNPFIGTIARHEDELWDRRHEPAHA